MTTSLPTGRHLTALLLVAAAAFPFGAAVALIPARGHIASPTVALLLVLVVVTVAAGTGLRGAALVAALSAGLSFDYFHTRPYDSLSIRSGEDIQTTALLLVTAAVVGALAAWGRRHRDIAAETADDIARLAAVSALVDQGLPAETIVLAAATDLAALLRLADCRFDRAVPSTASPRMEPDGEIIHAGRRWPADRDGLPGPQLALPVRHAGQTIGHYHLTPTPGAPVPLRRRQAAVLIATLVGNTLGHGASYG
jgi:hypothetical protein